ncbi:MAG: hypothetical protein NUV45_09405 [Tepidanaerobacteraceae bacterium]|jgi:hypothetical protein|nr:hypothetical protein [Tepidanaerobacteraceae bacterium]
MLKIFRIYFVLILAVCILLLPATAAHAKDYVFPSETAKTIVKDYHSKSNIDLVPNPLGKSDLIDVWYVALHDFGNGDIGVEGSTETGSKVEEVRVTVELQKKTNSSWVTVKKWSAEELYSDKAYYFNKITVDKGHYYRLKGTHYAENGSETETQTSYTDSYLID